MRRHRDNRDVEDLYSTHAYLEAYSRHTDLRVAADPEAAAGGLWEELGQLQARFLISEGLAAHHTLLDLGCGPLRAGRHFIRYLDAGHYVGFDISSGAITAARALVRDEGLTDRVPQLIVNEGKDLQFTQFRGRTFDFILAQSVFTHLKPEHIRECFAHIDSLMHSASAFYFTFSPATEYRQRSLKDFSYPHAFFRDLAKRHAFVLHDCADRYPHPRGQVMMVVRKAQ